MRTLRHSITLALIAEALSLLLAYCFRNDWSDDPLSSLGFWALLPHLPAIVLLGYLFQHLDEPGVTLGVVVPTLILWILFFYVVRLAWRYFRACYASSRRAG